jgi:hypothetical protein
MDCVTYLPIHTSSPLALGKLCNTDKATLMVLWLWKTTLKEKQND